MLATPLAARMSKPRRRVRVRDTAPMVQEGSTLSVNPCARTKLVSEGIVTTAGTEAGGGRR